MNLCYISALLYMLASEDVAQQLGKELRCPVCQGMPIGESPSPMAQDMMKKVRHMALEGQSEQQIKQYFVDRYGEWVLLLPPKHGLNWLLWLLPPVGLVVATLLLLWRIKRAIANPKPVIAANDVMLVMQQSSTPTTPQPHAMHRVLWPLITIVFIVILFMLLKKDIAPQVASNPKPAMQSGLSASEQQEIHDALGCLADKPNDIASLQRLSHLLLKAQMIQEAQAVNHQLLQVDPNNLEGRVHAAVLIAALGNVQQAQEQLQNITQTHANMAEAWFFQGMLAMQNNQLSLMRDSFKAFVSVAPAGPQRSRIEAMLAQMPAEGML